jgi:hypothetical protein
MLIYISVGTSAASNSKEILNRKGVSTSVVRWNPRKKSNLALGFSDGK